MFKSRSARDRAEESDCLIVIGSQLKISLPMIMVKDAAKRGALIIEINTEPVIEYGNVHQFTGRSSEILSQLSLSM